MDTLELLREAGLRVQRIRQSAQKIEEGIIELCAELGQVKLTQPPAEKAAHDLSGLTARQSEIFKLMALDLGTEEIAKRLGLERKTVEAHQNTIRLGLKFATADELREFARQHKLKG